MSLSKAYNPQDHEEDIYSIWEENKLFAPEVNPDGAPFCIVLPPPNATGQLHMGHAVMLALEDIMVRYHRMKGDAALWLPGTDHAAIATQSKVEKILLKEEGKTRYDLGREDFLNKVKDFVEDSRDTIRNQTRRMGSSLDWSRERYTLSDELNRVVNEVFIKMHNDGLLFRGHRIVNWDPVGQTTVADDEINYVEETTKFYTLKYGPFQIGTARPETKFGDKYVVMHPDDERYKQYEDGQKIELEWINGPITATIVKDKAIDMNFGTGVMTITPWHDVTDFEIAERHGLQKEQIIDEQGKLLSVAGEFAGMDIETARPLIAQKMADKGLLVSVDDNYKHRVAVGDRFKGKIEPQIKEQWFVDVNKPIVEWKGERVSLKKMMQDAVRSGDINIIPDKFNKVYYNWVDNLRPWCVSRQIWWGHRVPVWYHKETKEMKVQIQSPGQDWEQDPDTLDTWFSSSFWTWSTLIDPELTKDTGLNLDQMLEKSPDFHKFHPTDVLETAYDILFFWVARMILMTGYITGEVPFKTVYLHGLVRDKQGRKISKSLDNGIDPIDMIEKFGADAVRLSMVIGTTPGNDTRLYEEKIAGYRNFVNKLWNIARYILSSVPQAEVVEKAPEPQSVSDRWILSRFNTLVNDTQRLIEEFKFSLAGEKLYDFTWRELADWYVEDSKIEGDKNEILLYLLTNLLKLWHPFTPYVTEVLWKELNPQKDQYLITSGWPRVAENLFDSEAEELYSQYTAVLTTIRNVRAEFKISYGTEMKVVVENGDERFADLIKSQAKLSSIEFAESFSSSERVLTYHLSCGTIVHLFVQGLIDVENEKARLQNELESAQKYLASVEAKLTNEQFVQNAPEQVVAEQKEKMEQTKIKLSSLREQITALS